MAHMCALNWSGGLQRDMKHLPVAGAKLQAIGQMALCVSTNEMLFIYIYIQTLRWKHILKQLTGVVRKAAKCDLK